MSAERYASVKEVFVAARDLPAKERQAFVDQACGDDAELRSAVERLLRRHDELSTAPPGQVKSVALPPGTRLGSYEILELLGSGGMGEVYRALDPRLGRHLAIKVLPRTAGDQAEAVARFEREARSASALNHPCIVHIYQVGEEDTDAGPLRFIAMELVEGETLRARLRARQPWRELLEPLATVADALAKAHEAGIIHRDLKPENLMISDEGWPKILDFGLAKLTERSGPADAATPMPAFDLRTREGAVLGTPGYMSPEQVQGRPIDHRADIFAPPSSPTRIVSPSTRA